MWLTRLRLTNLRNIAALELPLEPGLTLFTGANGAGKTSILEGAYLLSHAQSFRVGQHETLIRHGADVLALHAQIQRQSGSVQIGLGRRANQWEARINGDAAGNLGAMLREFALVCFEPGSHALISGGNSERRRFLDWGVFHVEHDYLASMRRFRRVLRQRNQLLKHGALDRELDIWDVELVRAADSVTALRHTYFDRYAEQLATTLALFLPELGEVTATLASGWPDGVGLLEALRETHNRDRARGHTTCGPHRADWRIRFAHAPLREHLSRGQEKLCALACVLAQAELYAKSRGEWPVIALDDLASELDATRQQIVVGRLLAAGAQVLMTGIDVPECLRRSSAAVHMFHVEHGQVRSLL